MNSASPDIHPFVQLTAALGGRPLYTWLWLWWLFLCAVAVTGIPVAARETATFRIVVALGVSSIGLLFVTVVLLRGLRCEKREELLRKQPESNAAPLLRFLVWVVPVVGLAAVLSPFLFR